MHLKTPWCTPHPTPKLCPNFWPLSKKKGQKSKATGCEDQFSPLFVSQVGELPASERAALMSRFELFCIWVIIIAVIIVVIILVIMMIIICNYHPEWTLLSELLWLRGLRQVIGRSGKCLIKIIIIIFIIIAVICDIITRKIMQGLPRDTSPVPGADGGRPGHPWQLPGAHHGDGVNLGIVSSLFGLAVLIRHTG